MIMYFIKELESFFYAGGNGMSLEKIKDDEYLVGIFYQEFIINKLERLYNSLSLSYNPYKSNV